MGWRLILPASSLFTQSFIQAQIKENIKAPRHWPLVNSPHKWPVTRKMYPFDDVIMLTIKHVCWLICNRGSSRYPVMTEIHWNKKVSHWPIIVNRGFVDYYISSLSMPQGLSRSIQPPFPGYTIPDDDVCLPSGCWYENVQSRGNH